MSEKPKRRRSTCLGCGGVLLLLLLVFFLFFAAQFRSGANIRRAHETTRITEPINEEGMIDYLAHINQESSQGITPDENAAIDYFQIGQTYALAEEYSDGEQDKLKRWLGVDSFDPYAPQLTQMSTELSYNDDIQIAYERPWDETELPDLAAWLDEQMPAMEVAREASKKPAFFLPLVSDDDSVISAKLGLLQVMRQLARIWQIDAMRRLKKGDAAGALENVECMHRTARQIGKSPTLICSLVGIAIEGMAMSTTQSILASGQLTKEELVQVAERMSARPSFINTYKQIDQTERFMALDITQRLAMGEDIDLYTDMDFGPAIGRVSGSFDWNVVLEVLNESYDELAAAFEETDLELRTEKLNDFEERLEEQEESIFQLGGWMFSREGRSTRFGYILGQLFLPATLAVSEAELRTKSVQDLTMLAALIHAHKLEHGSFPESLDQLNLPDGISLPTDPFNQSAPLTYRLEKEGFVLYSYGRNRLDNGGVEDPPGDDFVVRYPPIINEEKNDESGAEADAPDGEADDEAREVDSAGEDTGATADATGN